MGVITLLEMVGPYRYTIILIIILLVCIWFQYFVLVILEQLSHQIHKYVELDNYVYISSMVIFYIFIHVELLCIQC